MDIMNMSLGFTSQNVERSASPRFLIAITPNSASARTTRTVRGAYQKSSGKAKSRIAGPVAEIHHSGSFVRLGAMKH